MGDGRRIGIVDTEEAVTGSWRRFARMSCVRREFAFKVDCSTANWYLEDAYLEPMGFASRVRERCIWRPWDINLVPE